LKGDFDSLLMSVFISRDGYAGISLGHVPFFDFGIVKLVNVEGKGFKTGQAW
jgi:hypothetical protein